MIINEKRLKLNVVLSYFIVFFHNLIFAYVIERLFSLSRGIDLQELALLEVVYCACVILLEVPSGYIADIWSRKKLMVIGAFLTCLEFAICIYAHSLWLFILATVVTGIGKAFTSGADNAILYDSLKLLKREESFKKHLRGIRTFDYCAGIIAALSGAYIASRTDLTMNYVLSLGSCIIVLVCTMLLKDVRSSSEVEATEEIKTLRDFGEDMKTVSRFFFHNPWMLFVGLCGILSSGVVTQIDEYYQILLNDIGIPIYRFGFVSLFSLAACTVGTMISMKFDSFFKRRRGYIMVILMFALLLLVMSTMKSFVVVIPIFLFYLGFAVMEPSIIENIHENIQGDLRATTESFYSLCERAAVMILVVPFGVLSENLGIRRGIIFLSVITIIGVYALSMIPMKNNDKTIKTEG